MIIVSQNRTEVVNFDKFYALRQRGLCVGLDYDLNSSVGAFYNIGEYKSVERCREVVNEIVISVEKGKDIVVMPEE